jgi:DNA-binding NarL/FixJ family response regulator
MEGDGNMKVLLLEKHTSFRSALRLFLEKKFQVESIAEGQDLRILHSTDRNEIPDLVLLDLSLLNGSGKALHEWLQPAAQDVPVILLYQRHNEELITESCRNMAYACVSKDRVYSELPDYLEKLFRQHGVPARG